MNNRRAKRRRGFETLVLGACFFVFLSCITDFRESSREGSGTNTGNSIAAVFEYENGQPAAKASARIRPFDFRSAPSNLSWLQDSMWANTYTDSVGSLLMGKVPSGKYRLEVNDQRGWAWQGAIEFLEDSSLVDMGKITLKQTGVIRGVVPLTTTIEQAYIQIVGLETFAWVDLQTWVFELSGVPEGNYELEAIALEGSVAQADTTWIDVFSDSQALILDFDLSSQVGNAFPQWKHSATVQIDNSLLGLAPSTKLTQVPIPLRIRNGDLPFSQMRLDGSDMRFSNMRGDSLNFEIEFWDIQNQQALVWVLLDTLDGAAPSQELNVHWGNPLAPNVSSGPSVFSTAQNYHGVWHLAPQGLSAIFGDASGNNNSARFQNRTDNILGASQLGPAVNLNGEGQYLSTSVLDTNPNTFTLSAWFKTSSDQGGKLLGYGWPDTGDGTANFERQLWMTDSGHLHFGVLMDPNLRDGWPGGVLPDSVIIANLKIISSPVAFNDDQWHHVVVVLSSGGGEMYVDGTLQSSDPNMTFGANRPGYWRIGAGPVQLNPWWSPWPPSPAFKGSMDEVRIQYRSSSSAEIQTMYQLQRPDLAWLQFIP